MYLVTLICEIKINTFLKNSNRLQSSVMTHGYAAFFEKNRTCLGRAAVAVLVFSGAFEKTSKHELTVLASLKIFVQIGSSIQKVVPQ